ncbi:MAG: hypothetical protein K6C96_06230 [Butyrivibrio sp.]|nr:hypothetical protein [Butyrivibrio sp.]
MVNSDPELGNKIAAKGTTVVNVYYDREVVTINFRLTDSWGSDLGPYDNCPQIVGLFGQTLASQNYTWPSERVWRRNNPGGGQTTTTFLDAFIPPTGVQGYTITYYSNSTSAGSATIRHYKQDLNGQYTILANQTKGDKNATFTFTNKYNGFEVVQYSSDGRTWQNTSAGKSTSLPTNLYVRYMRNTYQLDLMKAVEPVDPATGDPTGTTPVLVHSYDTLYEKPFSAMETTVRNEAKNVTAPAGYKVKTDGQGNPILYADPQGKDIFVWGNDRTMPSNNVCVYVVFTKARYNVLLDLNVDGDKNIATTTGYDTVTHPNHQSTDFNPYYNAEISRDALMGFEREGYDLVGWFFASGPKEDQPYDYANVTGDVKIYAKWRKTGGVYINYDTNGGTINPDALDEHLYAADSAVVVTAPAYKEDFTFVGWMLLDKDGNDVARYYPNSSFNILDDYIAPGSDGKSYVTLRADYVPTGLNPDDLHTSFTYHPNGGGGSPVTISEIGEGDARHQLFVNEAVPVWSKSEAEANGFVRDGYDLIGWNINQAAATAGEVQVGFDGKYVIADNDDNPDNPSANILYAVWKPQVVVHVYIEGAKDTKPYTGSEQQVSGFTVKKIEYKVGGHDYPSGSGFSPSDVKLKEAGLDIAKGTNVDTYYMGLTEDSFVSENPNFKKVVFHVTDGQLTITPVTVNIKITGNKDSQAYDGEEHTVEGYTATADVAAYDVNKIAFSGTASATRKDKGTTDMGLSAGQFSNTDPNYTATFTVVDGSMTITPIDITVTIKGHFSTDPYDGQEHVVTGYDVEIPGSLYTEDDFTFSGEAKAARTNEGTTMMNLAASQFTNTNENFATVTFNVTDGYQTITKVGDVVVTITGHSDTKDYDGQEHSVSGYDVVISNPLYKENDFTFSGEDVAKRTIAGTTDMGLKESMFTNNNSNFENVTFVVNDGSMTINPINVTVTITGNTGYADYDGEEHSVTGYEVTDISNPLYKEDDFDFDGNDTAKGTDVATYDMGLAAGQFTNTNENFATVTFNVTDGWIKINPVPVTVNITGHTDTKTYDGQEHEVTGYDVEVVGGLLPEEDIIFTGTDSAKRTDVGTTPMGLDDSMFSADNPNFSSVTFNVTDGSIEITPASATVYIEGNKDSKPYNGSEYTVSGYEVKEITNPLYTENDFTYNGSDSVSGTNAGTYPMGLTQAGFENTNPNFVNVTFIVKDGSLEITPITATVTITGAKDSKPYNGQEQGVSGYDVRIDSDLYTEADFTFSGTDEAKGTDAGTYPMGLAASQFTNTNKNFKDVTFNVTDGEMEITPIDVTVNITGHHDTKTYDGQTHTARGYDVDILNDLYKRDDFKFTGSAIASRKDEGTTQMGLDASQFENLNTTNFGTVTFNVTDGYMTIVPVDEVVVTITGHSNTVDYNGQEQSVEGYEVEFSNPLYTASDFTFKGEAKAARTDVGTTDMTMKEADFTNISTNFKKVTFVVNNGYITVNPISVTVTVKGHNDMVTYDGEEHTATGYDLTADNQLYDVTKVKYNGDATAARTDAGTTQMGLDKDLFENTDPNFSNVSFVIEEDGFITVEPLEVTVTVKGNTREEIYNGSEYEVKGYTLEADNELYDANASVTYDGEAVARGTLPNTYDMGLTDTAFGNKDENFIVTFEVTDGYLKITDRPDGEKYTITVTVDDVTKEYTGEVFSGFGYNVAGGKQVKAQEGAAQNIVNFFTGILKPLTAGAADDDAKDPTVTIDGVTYKVMGLSIEQEQRNVGEYPLKVTGTMHIEDLEGHNMDAQFADPVITDGTLKITPRIMEVESGSSQKVYDGTPLKNGTVTANRSWGIGDEISYDVTGSQTQVGSSKNTFTVVAGEGTDLKNYEINRIFGTLTVTRRTTPPPPPGDNPTTIVDPPTPTTDTPVVVTEVPAVLGEQRGRDGAAVLGARRGRTDDPANTAARYIAIFIAAAAAILLILTGRKKKEDDEE